MAIRLDQVPSLTRTDVDAIDAFASQVRAELGQQVVDLRLFGSKARGNATPESDIDVLVVVDAGPDRWRLATSVSDVAFAVNLAHGVLISPVVVSVTDAHDPVWRDTPFLRSAYLEGIAL